MLVDVDAGIATITLNRPARYNALTSESLTSMQYALDQVAGDASIWVVIIGAKGNAFCSSHDLKEMRSSKDQAFHRAIFDQCSRMMQTNQLPPQPVIARVNGIDAAVVLRYGLINEIVPGEELESAARKLAEKIAAQSPTAIRTGKNMFYRQLNMELNAAYEFAS